MVLRLEREGKGRLYKAGVRENLSEGSGHLIAVPLGN